MGYVFKASFLLSFFTFLKISNLVPHTISSYDPLKQLSRGVLNAIWVALRSFRLHLSLPLVWLLICIYNCYWSRLTSVGPLCFTALNPPFCLWKAMRTHYNFLYQSHMLCNITRGDSSAVWFSFYVNLF